LLLALILALVALALWHLPVSFALCFTWEGLHKAHGSLTILGFLTYSRDLAPVRRSVSSKPPSRNWNLDEIRMITRHVHWRDVRLDIHVGTGDAAITGVTVGSLWGVTGSTVPLLCNYLGVPPRIVRIQISPDFKRKILKAEASFCFSIRLGSLLAIYWRTRRKGNVARPPESRGLPGKT